MGNKKGEKAEVVKFGGEVNVSEVNGKLKFYP